MAPPWTLGSLAKLTAGMPPIWPEAATAPLSSCGVSSRTVPGSNRASRRASGSRLIATGAAWPSAPGRGTASAGWIRLSSTVTEASLRWRGAGSGGGEGERHVVPAETEGVVQRRHGCAAVRGKFPWLGGDVDPDVLVRVVQVDGRRCHPVAQGEDGGYRLHGPGAAEQVPGHRLGGGHHHSTGRRAERRGDGVALDDVAGRGGGGVRVHVHDLVRVKPGVGEHRL